MRGSIKAKNEFPRDFNSSRITPGLARYSIPQTISLSIPRSYGPILNPQSTWGTTFLYDLAVRQGQSFMGMATP